MPGRVQGFCKPQANTCPMRVCIPCCGAVSGARHPGDMDTQTDRPEASLDAEEVGAVEKSSNATSAGPNVGLQHVWHRGSMGTGGPRPAATACC